MSTLLLLVILPLTAYFAVRAFQAGDKIRAAKHLAECWERLHKNLQKENIEAHKVFVSTLTVKQCAQRYRAIGVQQIRLHGHVSDGWQALVDDPELKGFVVRARNPYPKTLLPSGIQTTADTLIPESGSWSELGEGVHA